MASLINLTIDMVGLSYTELNVDRKFWRRRCRDLCENRIAHCLFVCLFLLLYLRWCVFRLWQDSHKSVVFNLFWPMDHIFSKYPMGYFAMLTPH